MERIFSIEIHKFIKAQILTNIHHNFDFREKFFNFYIVSTELEYNRSIIPFSKKHLSITSFSNFFFNNKFMKWNLWLFFYVS
jgi:hypothetical protein